MKLESHGILAADVPVWKQADDYEHATENDIMNADICSDCWLQLFQQCLQKSDRLSCW